MKALLLLGAGLVGGFFLAQALEPRCCALIVKNKLGPVLGELGDTVGDKLREVFS